MARRQPNGGGTIYRRKDGRWEGAAYLQTSAGTRKRIRVYGPTQAVAHECLVAKLAQAQRGVPVPERAWRMAAYFDYWLPIVRRTRRPTTYLSYESIVRLYLKPGLGSKQLSRLTVADLQLYLDGQLEAGRSVRTVQKQRMVLSAALARAQREELVIRNVAHHVELPTWQRKEIIPWTSDQLTTFLQAARSDPLYLAFLLLALYGLRRGEVLGLRWDDIDIPNRRLRIRQQLQRYDGQIQLGPVKTHAGQRDLPLLNVVVARLPPRPSGTGGSGLVFTTRFDNPIEGGNLLRSFERITRLCGLPRLTLHHLRHTAATLLKNLGVPARDAQLILGHAHISTTQQLYQHADLAGQQAALALLEQQLLTGIDGYRSRQNQPSNPIYYRKLQRSNFGGSSQIRTGDTRLFSTAGACLPSDLTEVRTLARSRYGSHLLGSAAVMFSRQPGRCTRLGSMTIRAVLQ
jgi:integrase